MSENSQSRRDFIKNSTKLGVAVGAVAMSPLLASANSSKNSPKTSTKSGANAVNSTSKGAKMQTITLKNGVLKPVEMPILGYGTYQIPNAEAQRCVEDALSVGYRLIDTAQAYGNEEGIGNALKTAMKGGLKREDLFIETKLWISHISESKALGAFEASCKKLGVDFVDLYLLHQPYNDSYGAWRAMTRLLHEGRIRAIGVSNFYPDKLTDFAMFNEVKPALNQIELHPFFQKTAEQKLNEDLGVAVQSWASFAEGQNGIFSNAVLKKIGEKYGKTPAQVILRWLIERGIAVIPKTTRKARMAENFAVFDFALSADDKGKIAALDTNKTLFLDHRDPEKIRYLAGFKA